MKYIYMFLFFIFLVPCARAQDGAGAGPALGRPLADAEAALVGASIVWPDGRGLPPGRGSVGDGRALYRQRCLACHGERGRGGLGGELAGGRPHLTAEPPDQNIGTYWPHATTVFDFVRRAMPLDAPWSLSDSEVYAVVAYLLHLNGLLEPDASLDATALAGLRMPNADGFDAVEGPAADGAAAR